MSNRDPIVASRNPKGPGVVDISGGEWKFGYHGSLIKKALYEKVGMLEEATKDILNQLERELGANMSDVAALLVAVHSPTMNTKARYIKALCERAVELDTMRSRLARAAKGFNDDMVYVISLSDMEEMGL